MTKCHRERSRITFSTMSMTCLAMAILAALCSSNITPLISLCSLFLEGDSLLASSSFPSYSLPSRSLSSSSAGSASVMSDAEHRSDSRGSGSAFLSVLPLTDTGNSATCTICLTSYSSLLLTGRGVSIIQVGVEGIKIKYSLRVTVSCLI
jgi:hypothetical protein